MNKYDIQNIKDLFVYLKIHYQLGCYDKFLIPFVISFCTTICTYLIMEMM